MSKAVEDIVAERKRHVEVEGWTPEHDDEHHRGQLALAASVYAYAGSLESGQNMVLKTSDIIHRLWPWDWSWFKPTDRRRDLVKAGALIVADIERLDRVAANKS